MASTVEWRRLNGDENTPRHDFLNKYSILQSTQIVGEPQSSMKFLVEVSIRTV